MRNRWLLGALAVGALVAIAAAASLWMSPAVAVRVQQAERGRVESTITNSKAGTVRARRRANLSPEIGGRVVELPFREGDRVEAGAVLVALNDAAQRAELQHTRRSLKAAEAGLRESQLEWDFAGRELARTRQLAELGIVSDDLRDEAQSVFDRASAARDALAAEVEKARAGIAVAQAELEKSVIRAPFAGVLAELDVELGEWVTPESPYIAVVPPIDIIDLTSLYVSAPMDEVDAGRVVVGQPVRVSLDSHPGASFAARVVRVAPYVLAVEEQNRTVEIEVVLDAAELSATLLPGTSADVEVVLEVREDVVRIPTAALQAGGSVLRVRGERLEQVPVRVGLRNWHHAEIESGLEPGEQVVVSLDRPGVEVGARVVIEPDPS